MTTKSEEPIFDRADLYERVMGDEALLSEILELFVEDGALQIERINEAVEAGEAKLVASAAHALKGAASNISAPVLARAASELERTTRSGQLADVSDLVTRVQTEFERFKQVLDS